MLCLPSALFDGHLLDMQESTIGAAVASSTYSESVSVREAVTQTVSEITTTTLKEVQQVASVLEQCVVNISYVFIQ